MNQTAESTGGGQRRGARRGSPGRSVHTAGSDSCPWPRLLPEEGAQGWFVTYQMVREEQRQNRVHSRLREGSTSDGLEQSSVERGR